MIQLFLSKVYTQENWKQFLHKNLYANVHSEVKWKSLSHVRLFATPLTKQSVEFFRILEWVAFPSPGGLPNPGIEPRSPRLQADSLPAEPPGKPNVHSSISHNNQKVEATQMSSTYKWINKT